MDIVDRIQELCKQQGITKTELERRCGMSQNSINKWRNSTPNSITLFNVARELHTSVRELLEHTEKVERFAQEFSENEMYTFPVIGTICAGYDGIAEESYTGEDMIVPPYLIKTRNPDDYFVLEVKGDSMSPLLENGDKVLIRRCNTVDSGTVAAVGFNDEQATVKKVEYIKGEDWMRLVPRNPDYPVITIKGSDLEVCRVYGEVVYLFRDKIGF